MDYQKVGLLIASLRKEKGLTQKELANKLNITDRAVSKWERGLGCPDVSLLDDLSKTLDVSILEILKGRRLEKEEIINNRNVIESMNYSKEIFKYKIMNIFNLMSTFIIIIICLLLLFFNLASIYYLNKAYYNNSYDESNERLFGELSNNIAIIRNNQGIYNVNEYKEILKFIDAIDDNSNENNLAYYYYKKTYSYKEILTFHESYNLDMIKLDNSIYKVVHNYNPNVVDNMIKYSKYSDSLIFLSLQLYEDLNHPYYNGKKIDNDVVNTITSFIYLKYSRNNMLLKDIIEVGGINE
jgi:transcriptional regulator with XRE-family HTH domain